jgi:3-deoxy-D-manno-octulosonic-acid transferase
VSEALPTGLRLYRLLSTAGEPLTSILLARRLARGKELDDRIGERRGETAAERPAGPLVWLHGASVGELMSVLPLIERLSARGLNVLVTTGTVTSSGVAAQRMPGGVIHQFMPLDVPNFVARFLDRWQPQLALFVESDLWPNMLIETARRKVPMVLVNARLSERSFRRWLKLPRSIGHLLERFDLCLARTPPDAERLTQLGARNVFVSGNLKLDVPAPPADEADLAALKAAIGERPLIAAASTHPGEDELIVAAHKRLRATAPGLLTLIAPRHPERGPEIVALARAAGLSVALRSQGALPAAATDVYVADTMGELGLVYRLAPVVFIGGSLVRHGGQNPIEAAKLGAAILHGPHISNFEELYATLDAAHGAEPVDDGERLTAAFGAMLAQPAVRARVAQAGRSAVNALGGALDRTMQALEPYLSKLKRRQDPPQDTAHA